MTRNSSPWYLKTKSLNSYKNLCVDVKCSSAAPISPSKRKQSTFPSAGKRTNKAGHRCRMGWPNVYYKVHEIWKDRGRRQRIGDCLSWAFGRNGNGNFPFGALQMPSTGWWQRLHHSAMRKLSNYTLCGWIVWYVNYISTKLLKRISKTSVFFD